MKAIVSIGLTLSLGLTSLGISLLQATSPLSEPSHLQPIPYEITDHIQPVAARAKSNTSSKQSIRWVF